VTGKPRGLDLRDGNPSLPIVLALAGDAELRRLFASPELGPAEIEAGIARIRHSGVLAAVADRARGHVDAAREEIARLPDGPARAALDALALTLVARKN